MPHSDLIHRRLKSVFLLIVFGFLIIGGRLFYWQVIKASSLKTQALNQTINQDVIRGQRGKIYTADGSLLVGNQTAYQLFINKKELELDQLELVNRLTELLKTDYLQQLEEQNSKNVSEKNKTELTEQYSQDLKQILIQRLESDSSWIMLQDNISSDLKNQIQSEQIVGLHFIETDVRVYPEGSIAAHLTGFLGKDEQGNNLGYFGIEGALNRELEASEKRIQVRRDGEGRQLADQKIDFTNLDGRDITLSIRRDLQFIAEEALAAGVKRYQSLSGEIVIMDPETGEILALATYPHYDPADYRNYSTKEYKNPVLANLYEPGSTFKTITVAAGLDSGAVTPDTTCSDCTGPKIIDDYTIKTWNDEYNPGITVKEALRKSDNIAMIGVTEKIGSKQFLDYLHKFGLGEALNVDLQEDFSTPMPDNLGPVELATASFGQGISVNSLQLIRAVSAIANQGLLMKPILVKEVYDPQTQETIHYKPQISRRVIETETAARTTELMVHSAPERSNWISQNYTVAGKTGTAQIASRGGGYRDEGTIASYIGFAPAENPKFVMLVKLQEPQLSPWGATTAVPIWYDVADKIILRL